MTKFKILLFVIAISQLVLGALTLFVPGPFFAWMGLSTPPTDNYYMLAMLAARFIAYGIGFLVLARAQSPDPFWIRNMALIQGIDFAAGGYYLITGTITLAVAGFPMANALIFAHPAFVLGTPDHIGWNPAANRFLTIKKAAQDIPSGLPIIFRLAGSGSRAGEG